MVYTIIQITDEMWLGVIYYGVITLILLSVDVIAVYLTFSTFVWDWNFWGTIGFYLLNTLVTTSYAYIFTEKTLDSLFSTDWSYKKNRQYWYTKFNRCRLLEKVLVGAYIALGIGLLLIILIYFLK